MTATMLLPWAFGIICSKTGFTCSRFCASAGVTPIAIAVNASFTKTALLSSFQYLFLVYCSVEKLMHQRPNPIHFFFQREMARVEKMELCAWDIPFVEFSTLHRKDSIVFAPSDQRGGLLFTEILLPIGIDFQIPFCVVED